MPYDTCAQTLRQAGDYRKASSRAERSPGRGAPSGTGAKALMAADRLRVCLVLRATAHAPRTSRVVGLPTFPATPANVRVTPDGGLEVPPASTRMAGRRRTSLRSHRESTRIGRQHSVLLANRHHYALLHTHLCLAQHRHGGGAVANACKALIPRFPSRNSVPISCGRRRTHEIRKLAIIGRENQSHFATSAEAWYLRRRSMRPNVEPRRARGHRRLSPPIADTRCVQLSAHAASWPSTTNRIGAVEILDYVLVEDSQHAGESDGGRSQTLLRAPMHRVTAL